MTLDIWIRFVLRCSMGTCYVLGDIVVRSTGSYTVVRHEIVRYTVYGTRVLWRMTFCIAYSTSVLWTISFGTLPVVLVPLARNSMMRPVNERQRCNATSPLIFWERYKPHARFTCGNNAALHLYNCVSTHLPWQPLPLLRVERNYIFHGTRYNCV